MHTTAVNKGFPPKLRLKQKCEVKLKSSQSIDRILFKGVCVQENIEL